MQMHMHPQSFSLFMAIRPDFAPVLTHEAPYSIMLDRVSVQYGKIKSDGCKECGLSPKLMKINEQLKCVYLESRVQLN